MPKRSSKPSLDPNVAAFRAVSLLTGGGQATPKPVRKSRKNPAAVALGRKGGKVGGKRRAELLTSEQRRDIASRAAIARWARREPE